MRLKVRPVRSHLASWAVSLLFAALFGSTAFASNNPIPQVVGPPVPQAVASGSQAFTLKVYGANFVQGAVVNWNRSPRTTTFVSARELHAQILATDVAKPTAGYITVTNPAPGGGPSSTSYAQVEVHAPTSTIHVGKPDRYLYNRGTWYLTLADFNNDGNFDFVVGEGYSRLQVFLGDSRGKFRSAGFLYNYYGAGPSNIAAGDFNNDGNEDVVFGAGSNGPPTENQLDLGNGDGIFRLGSRFWKTHGGYPWDLAVGDFNHDGDLDILEIQDGGLLITFLGDGSGDFQPVYQHYEVGSYEVRVADFNGDGILDLAVLLDTGDGGLLVLMGNGDGTFRKAQVVDSNSHLGCGAGKSLQVSDFNSDGVADLVYCERDQTDGKIWVALGNGDGTFKKASFVTVKGGGPSGFTFAAGDFNADNKTDLLASYDNVTSSFFDLYLGNGDGTFEGGKPVKLPGGVYNAELGLNPVDLNSDGLVDFIFQQPGDVAVFMQK